MMFISDNSRLIQSQNISFFLSPAPALSVDGITVSIVIDPSQYDSEKVPALLVWISKEEQVANSGGNIYI